MCLIAFNWQPQAPVPLTLIANRDEFYARPTQALHKWEDTGFLAGKDLQAGGTWLGVSHTGRVAALTNHRDVNQHRDDAPSRGDLTSAFLRGTASCAQYLETLAATAHQYNPFNLLVFDGHSAMGFESRHGQPFALAPGVGAVSNADFGTPWPKLQRLQAAYTQHLAKHGLAQGDAAPSHHGDLFAMLAERRLAADDALPHTGLPIERERALSAEFIHTPTYGTRASSLLFVHRHGASFFERSFDAAGMSGEVHHTTTWGTTL
ncbi:NRDE family protein [Rhodoferax aquaticus]|nr:NRDE family protein [Rhodoferax aquaticus]